MDTDQALDAPMETKAAFEAPTDEPPPSTDVPMPNDDAAVEAETASKEDKNKIIAEVPAEEKAESPPATAPAPAPAAAPERVALTRISLCDAAGGSVALENLSAVEYRCFLHGTRSDTDEVIVRRCVRLRCECAPPALTRAGRR